MAENTDLAANKLNNAVNGKRKKNELWEKLASTLNANGPPKKSISEWKKVWTDHKYNVKRKLIHNKNTQQKTGGGPYEAIDLSATEEMIVSAASLEPQVRGLDVNTYGATEYNSGNESENLFESDIYNDINVVDEIYDTISNEIPPNINRSNQSSKSNSEEEKLLLLKNEIDENKNFHIKMLDLLSCMKDNQDKLTEAVANMCEIEKEKLEIQRQNHADKRKFKNRELELRALELETARTANELKKLKLSKN